MKTIDVSFVIFRYCPRPNLPEPRDNVSIALAAFGASTDGRVLMVRKDYVTIVKGFGCAEDVDFVSIFLRKFNAGFVKCLHPDIALDGIRRSLQDANDVLQMSNIRAFSALSLGGAVAELTNRYLDNGEKFGDIRVAPLAVRSAYPFQIFPG